MLRICDEFESLLNSPDIDESKAQKFLEQPHHRFLVSPMHKQIFPRRPIAGLRLIPDFTVLRVDDEYHFVEIEDPKKPIYKSRTAEPAEQLVHAQRQVHDWLRYVHNNRTTVRDEDGLLTIDQPTGEVVAGRNSHFTSEGRKSFDYLKTRDRGITLRTYDDMIAAARAFAESLKKMSPPVSPF